MGLGLEFRILVQELEVQGTHSCTPSPIASPLMSPNMAMIGLIISTHCSWAIFTLNLQLVFAPFHCKHRSAEKYLMGHWIYGWVR